MSCCGAIYRGEREGLEWDGYCLRAVNMQTTCIIAWNCDAHLSALHLFVYCTLESQETAFECIAAARGEGHAVERMFSRQILRRRLFTIVARSLRRREGSETMIGLGFFCKGYILTDSWEEDFRQKYILRRLMNE